MSRPTWDSPNADPLADLADFLHSAWQRGTRPDLGMTLAVPGLAWDEITRRLGRPPVLADIPAGVPGNWTSMIRLDRPHE